MEGDAMASNDSPGRRKGPTPDNPPPTTRQRPASQERRNAELEMPPDAQSGTQKSPGGKSPDPERERHHANPGRDEKADMPRDDSR
jgi:hypothetical protein